MSLIQFHDVALAFGEQVLLRNADVSIHDGERVCLIGRNGAGKTSLLKLITGELEPDNGSIRFRAGMGISQLTQTLPDELDKTVREFVTAGLAEVQALAEEYRQRSATELDTVGLRELEALQRQIEAHGGWNIEQQVDTVISELGLPADKTLGELSGGWRRRVALGKALVSQPDLLLLDEPTNHLDLATIRWLEDRIYAWHGAVVFITHDRAFLQRLATRILEIDRTRLLSWDCDYRTYLKRKEQALQGEEEENARFDKKLAGEEVWVRQGIKARRTRNEGRVRALKSMREEQAGRIKRESGAHISIDEAERSGRKVIRMRNVNYAYGEQKVIKDLSLQVMRGARIGLVANNGVGKSTLLRLMLGELEPQQGTVKLGTNLEVAYFDQLQRELDPNKSVAEIVGDGRDFITINGKERHVVGYLRGFLFSAKRAMTPVRVLSGGERNRVILARLFTRPSNLLVLDEPTNDLDVETLEVLEARLAEYAGTLIVVSHDREFLDNAVTSILIFEDDGQVHEYVGGYSDWLKHGHTLANTEATDKKARAAEQAERRAQQKQAPKKLNYKQQQDLEKTPALIASLEQRIEKLQQETSAADFYNQPYEKTQPVLDELQQAHVELDKLTNRWLELEELQQKFTAAKQSRG
jgi:ATP-binding cassette subfamily F protein uup